jgi:RNA polymerase sigma factor (sigma-70 family)
VDEELRVGGDEPAGSLDDELRSAWHRYVDALTPLRPALHGYCRRLAGNLWDAEDLVQDTLLRAFGQWGVTNGGIREPRAYLLRTATNVWIDTLRRRQTEARAPDASPEDEPAPSADPAISSEMRDAGTRLLHWLAPRERAALVLKEVFEMSLEEIAELLATTTGAVKAALHRGRERLRNPDRTVATRRSAPSAEIVDRFIERYDAEDVPLRGARGQDRADPQLRVLPGDGPRRGGGARSAGLDRPLPRPHAGPRCELARRRAPAPAPAELRGPEGKIRGTSSGPSWRRTRGCPPAEIS